MLPILGRTTEQVKMGAGMEILSPGRLFTRTTIARYDSEYHAWLTSVHLAPLYAELDDLMRRARWQDVASLREKLMELEWNLAETSREGGLGVTQHVGNLMLNEGWDNDAWGLIIGVGSNNAFNNANARIGVGDSSTAAAATQTDLQAATNKLYVAMKASYPAKGGATTRRADFASDFTSGQANYAWAEFTIDNNQGTPINLLRVVSAQGTKTSGQTWTPTIQVTIT